MLWLQDDFVAVGTEREEFFKTLHELEASTRYKIINGKDLRFFQYYPPDTESRIPCQPFGMLVEVTLDPVLTGYFGTLYAGTGLDELLKYETEELIPEIEDTGFIMMLNKTAYIVTPTISKVLSTMCGISGKITAKSNYNLTALIKRSLQDKKLMLIERECDQIHKCFSLKGKDFEPHSQVKAFRDIEKIYPDMRITRWRIDHFTTEVIYMDKSGQIPFGMNNICPVIKVTMSNTGFSSTMIEPGWQLLSCGEYVLDKERTTSLSHKKKWDTGVVQNVALINALAFNDLADKKATTGDILELLKKTGTLKAYEAIVRETEGKYQGCCAKESVATIIDGLSKIKHDQPEGVINAMRERIAEIIEEII